MSLPLTKEDVEEIRTYQTLPFKQYVAYEKLLSALKGLQKELITAHKNIPNLKDMSIEKQIGSLMAIDGTLNSIKKWFPIINSSSQPSKEREG